MSRPVKLYYSRKSNLGDALNPYILEKVFYLKSSHSHYRSADLFMIGSILDKSLVPFWNIYRRVRCRFERELNIWSSGFISPPGMWRTPVRPLNIRALRGRLSCEILSSVTGRKVSVPFGDGGLFANRLLQDTPERIYSVGIVPHYREAASPFFAELQKRIPESVLISPLGEPLDVVKRIAQCRSVLSSSLHGLIVADAFSIPNRQLVGGDAVTGGLFKYKDYYSAFNLEISPLGVADALTSPPKEKDIVSGYHISSGCVDELRSRLEAAFPLDLFT